MSRKNNKYGKPIVSVPLDPRATGSFVHVSTMSKDGTVNPKVVRGDDMMMFIKQPNN
ncbi:hypothetical protein IC229_33615 [Spirosoma sp. BT702]|uniref:Uncharacterized protein n=1 Tax=Spirosoma profusum TaxID=2771354 RepID=A0A927GB12_9BACT|nr:hypothetical protein [Spirosoma profusum]MBD2705595.1 hypothetical protein [Spirosoma profusum]